MSFVIGAGALFAAFLLISLGRVAFSRGALASASESFGPAEAIAYVFTVLISLGLGRTIMATIDTDFPAALGELALALGLLAAACAATHVALGRAFPRRAAAGAERPPLPSGRAGSPSPEPRPGKPSGGAKRRAA